MRTSEDFLAGHPELLDRSILNRFYSPDLLAGEAARQQFIPPDREPLTALFGV